MDPLRFKEQGDVLTLYPEKIVDSTYVLGWSPEIKKNIAVDMENIVCECAPGMHQPDCLFVTGELA